MAEATGPVDGSTPPSRWRTSRQLRLAWFAALGAVLVLTVHPVSSGISRAAWLLAVAAALTLPPFLWPRDWLGRLAPILFVAVPSVLLALPARPFSPPALRASSVEVLRSFEGTRYVWGGEGRLGIDCSGLVRQSLLRAAFKAGLSSLNGDLLRMAASLWWFDTSARALRDGHRGQTRLIVEAPSVNDVPVARLAPGDFAVTSDGVHVLAYLGGHRWIEADPGLGRVVVVETPATNPWFSVPVHVMRWRAFE